MDPNRSVQVHASDTLPAICVVCGAAATDSCLVPCKLPQPRADKSGTMASVGIFLSALMAGKLLIPRPASRTLPDNWWLTLPTCYAHAVRSAVESAVRIQSVGTRTVQLTAVAEAFHRAVLEAQAARPASSVEAMQQFDAPRPDTGAFLGGLKQEKLADTDEFLRGLEGEPRAGS